MAHSSQKDSQSQLVHDEKNLYLLFQKEKASDLFLIKKNKLKWYYLIPVIGLIWSIHVINRLFKKLSLGISRKCYHENGTFLISSIGTGLITLMIATTASVMVATFYLKWFNSLQTVTDVLKFIEVILSLVFSWLMLVNYFLILFFYLYIQRRVEKKYESFVNSIIISLDWNDQNQVIKTIAEDRYK